MYYHYCGNQIQIGSMYCPKCGKKLSAPELFSENETELNEDTWYCWNNTEMEGPVTAETIREELTNGTICLDAKVRRNFNESWKSLYDSPFADIAIKLTPEPISISDKWIWCMSIIPLTIIIVLYVLKIDSSMRISGLIGAVLFLGFMYADKLEIDNSGFEQKSWVYTLGLLIAPSYLLTREIRTNRNFVPVIITLSIIIGFCLYAGIIL